MKKVRLTAVFHGTVQGVGFRYSTQRLAVRRPVDGFVENEHTGTVLLVAEGAETELKAFLDTIKTSRLGRLVKRVEESWGPATNDYKSFDIRY